MKYLNPFSFNHCKGVYCKDCGCMHFCSDTDDDCIKQRGKLETIGYEESDTS